MLAGITEQLHRNPKFSKELVKYLEKSMPVWDHHMRDKILEAFKSHPVMRMEVRSRGFDSEENVESGEWVEEGGEAVLYVTIEKENNCSNRVMVQKHTKIKDVTWWILVADNRNNLLALRKASIKKRVELKMQVELPEDLTNHPVSVWLMADRSTGLK